MIRNFLSAIFLLCFSFTVISQETFPVNGVHDNRPKVFAFTNATVYVDYKTKIEKATVLIKDGKIEKVGVNISVPKGYVTVDINGKFIYPSFIELDSDYGFEPKKGAQASYRPQFKP